MKVRTRNGLVFDNPVGLAPGLETKARYLPGLFEIGFGFIELGSVAAEIQQELQAFP